MRDVAGLVGLVGSSRQKIKSPGRISAKGTCGPLATCWCVTRGSRTPACAKAHRFSPEQSPVLLTGAAGNPTEPFHPARCPACRRQHLAC